MFKAIRPATLTALVFLSIASSVLQTAKSVKAQNGCQCTDYVANRFNLSRDYPNAGDWNDGYLQKNGFVSVSPQPGAVVVMERQFPGADSNYGHVGVLESISPDGKIKLRGANQWVGDKPFTEANCSNVRLTDFGTKVNGRNDISFWVRKNSPQTGSDSNIHTVNFSAKAAPVEIKVRKDPSTKNDPVGRYGANQPISFDAWTYGEVVPDYWTGQPDARWYRVAGTQNWISSAVVAGNAPGSKPMP